MSKVFKNRLTGDTPSFQTIPNGEQASENMLEQDITALTETIIQRYRLRNPTEVLNYIDQNRALAKLLTDAWIPLQSVFPESNVHLEVIEEPDDSSFVELVASIETALDPNHAYELLRLFRQQWWLKYQKQAKSKLMFSLKFI